MVIHLAPQPSRSFLYDNKELELRLEASDRVTHQLSTAVFAIFIREVLGYRNVTITTRRDAFNVSAVLSRIFGCANERYIKGLTAYVRGMRQRDRSAIC